MSSSRSRSVSSKLKTNARSTDVTEVSSVIDGATDSAAAREKTAHWTFLTNHSHVLVLLARKPSIVLREVAAQVGITERAVQRIVADLEAAGVIDCEKVGRQNHYRVHIDRPLRHPLESHRTIGELLSLINDLSE